MTDRISKKTFDLKSLLRRGLIPTLIVIFPVLFLFPYFFSINGKHLLIGNDFRGLYFSYKFYLLDYLSHLSVPLWSPSEGAGFPFYSSSFTQTFYPLNIPLAGFYRFFNGYSVLDHQRFTILGISIFALGIYLWLKSLSLETRASLFATLVTSASMKIVEIIRFPNAVHSIAWFPWILLALTKIFSSRSKRKLFLYGAILFLSLVCLFTAGYPYYLYYLIFMLVPYLFIFIIPRLRRNLCSIEKIEWKRSLITLATAGLSALFLCAPYLYKVFTLLQETTDRGGNSFHYSTWGQGRLIDTIGSLTFPPAAIFDSSFYFGFIGVLLIAVFLFTRNNSNKKTDDEKTPKKCTDVYLFEKLFFVFWILLISLTGYGEKSFLFHFFWNYLPFFSSLRVWGRLNIVLVPIIAWLLSLAYEKFEMQLSSNSKKPDDKRATIIVLSATFFIILGVQIYVIAQQLYSVNWNNYFISGVSNLLNEMNQLYSWKLPNQTDWLISFFNIIFIGFAILSFVLLYIMIKQNKDRYQSDKGKNRLLISLTIFSILSLWIVTPFPWVRGITEAKDRYALNIQADSVNKVSFQVRRADIPETSITHGAGFSTAMFGNWYFDRYYTFRQWADLEPEASKQLLGNADGQKLYFSKAIDYATIQDFLDDAQSFPKSWEVESYTGDELLVSVETPDAGYFSFIDNWDSDWNAEIDGKPVSIEQLFGTFKSVYVPEGKHDIRFYYKPSLDIFQSRF